MNMKNRAELFLIGMTFIWGGTFVSIKVSLQFISPYLLMGFRFLIASLFIALISKRKIFSINKTLLFQGIFLGILMFFGYGLQTFGLKYTSASRSGFITYFYALLVPPLQFFILRKKPKKKSLIGLIFAFIGLYLITGGWGNGSFNKGDFITLIGAVAFAFYVIFISLWSTDDNSVLLSFLQMFVCSIISFLSFFAFETPYIVFSIPLILNLLYLSLLGSVVCVVIMNKFQAYLSPTRATIIYALEPIFSVIMALIILHESFSPFQVLGALSILSGVLYSELDLKRR